jgi:predicted transcriptional regulator
LHKLESEAMEQFWKSGEASVRSVLQALNQVADKDRASTTYMTIMARLHKKGLLFRRRDGKADYYAPAYERDKYMAFRASAEVEGLVSQYGERRAQPFRRADGKARPARRRHFNVSRASPEASEGPGAPEPRALRSMTRQRYPASQEEQSGRDASGGWRRSR